LQALPLGYRPWPDRHPRQLILKILRQIILKITGSGVTFRIICRVVSTSSVAPSTVRIDELQKVIFGWRLLQHLKPKQGRLRDNSRRRRSGNKQGWNVGSRLAQP
jgi:hypothetical protein